MRRALLLAALLLAALAAPAPAGAQGGQRIDGFLDRIDGARARVGPRGAGVLAIMGYNMTPDGSANSLQINQTTASDDTGSTLFTLTQYGSGFTLADSFPLYLEGYLGTARYDPRAVFVGIPPSVPSTHWNNVTTTIGIGWDFRLAEYWWLRPIFNTALGYATSDAALLADFVEYRRDADIPALTDRHVNTFAIGGSLTLAYYDYRPARDIDMELRYTQLELQTIGDTLQAARGRANAKTLSLWTRYRWPTGWEAFGRPVRWVFDGNYSLYLGDQEQVLGFAWAIKVGGGIEFDVGRYEVGALGLNVGRVRLVGRYFLGDNNITGFSAGIGVSF